MVINVSRDALPYILMQRTDYLQLPKRRFLYRAICKLSSLSPINTAVALESRLRRSVVTGEFNADMESEYNDIQSYLPERLSALLDVGCGVAGIDIHLYRHYGNDSSLRLYLLDRTQTVENISYGLAATGKEFYNSLDVTQDLLTSNGVPDKNIVLLEARDDCSIDIPERLDLVLSTISWGFHYPVATYLNRTYELLKPGGRMIIDVRKGSTGADEVHRKFGNLTTISEGPKRQRIMAIK